MKTAIVAGVTGQDGAYLSQLLLEKGYRVIGITRDLINPNFDNLDFLGITDKVEFIEQTDLGEKRIIAAIKRYQPDEVYNLAAQSSVSQSFKFPYETVSYNILSVMPWLEAIKTYSRETRFYQASSSEMFGNVRPNDLPLKESLIFRPASPYGVSKAAAHWLAINYREAYGIFSSCGILFNHESCLRGPNYVVKKLVNGAVKISLGLSSDPIFIGNTCIRRDWGYAPKYVQAMWRILQHHKPDDFLICSGNVISLDGLIDILMNELQIDRHAFIKEDPTLYRPVDLEEIYGDNSKAQDELGWNYDLTNRQLISQLIKDEIAFVEWQQSKKRSA